MAKITIEEISTQLKEKNWKIISTEYQNLNTEMTFECDEGHTFLSTWKKLRSKLECPVCKQNVLKENKPEVIKKRKNINRVLAIDQATYKTGWSIYDDNVLLKYGVFEVEEGDETERFYKVKIWLLSMIEVWEPDLIALEGIQYQNSFGVTTFQTLARLQGVLMDLCYEKEVPFKICPTNTWRAHCKVKGRTRTDKKKSMQLLVKEWFDINVSDDEADAIGIGKYASETFKKQTKIVNWE